MTQTLESVAREVFEEECVRPLHAGGGDGGVASLELCPVSWLLPGLLQLMAEQPEASVDRLRPAIRRMILDRAGQYAWAAGLSQADADAMLEGEVDLLVRVLGEVRRRALESGDWCERCAAPEMFG